MLIVRLDFCCYLRVLFSFIGLVGEIEWSLIVELFKSLVELVLFGSLFWFFAVHQQYNYIIGSLKHIIKCRRERAQINLRN